MNLTPLMSLTRDDWSGFVGGGAEQKWVVNPFGNRAVTDISCQLRPKHSENNLLGSVLHGMAKLGHRKLQIFTDKSHKLLAASSWQAI